MNSNFSNKILFNGTYDITISGPDELVKVTSTATFMGVNHTSIAEARADRMPFILVQLQLCICHAGLFTGVKNKPCNGSIKN